MVEGARLESVLWVKPYEGSNPSLSAKIYRKDILHIHFNNNYFISDITPEDKDAYLEHLKEKLIYDQTLAIPYPYTESSFNEWLATLKKQKELNGRSICWGIKNNENYLIGGIGYSNINYDGVKSHRSEIGYWLAKDCWNQGIMTAAIKKCVEIGFEEFDLIRITAHIFAFNVASQRVLEKAGFQFEGFLKKHYQKDGKIFDGKLYAIVR